MRRTPQASSPRMTRSLSSVASLSCSFCRPSRRVSSSTTSPDHGCAKQASLHRHLLRHVLGAHGNNINDQTLPDHAPDVNVGEPDLPEEAAPGTALPSRLQAMITLRQIEVIRAIMVAGTVNGAAKLLNVSAPGVSRTVKHAESVLGVRLFERRGGRFVQTPEAKVIFDQINRVH